MIHALGLSLVLTLLIELPIARVWGLQSRNLRLAVLVNLLTNPVVALLAMLFPHSLLLTEPLAVAVEAVCYRHIGDRIRQPVWLAVVANGISFVLGEVLQRVV